MQAFSFMNKYFFNSPCLALISISLICYLLIVNGTNGGFLFDDYPNLETLGSMGGVTNWETFYAFVFSGWSGPTGRPLSLASFLLDDNTWPSYAPWFKHTNLLIHILCGLLLCWATLLLMRNLKLVNEKQAQWVAVLACAMWLLHPYMVSTTLYVVQRMAQLATLFSLAGITLYLYGRLQLVIKPVRGYVLMTLAIGLFTVLATYSKENGALLPLLILVIEFCLPKDQNKPIWQWRAFCLWLPSLAIALLMARYINFSENPWPTRGFNQTERLLTEGRIVSEYLFHLFVPRIEGHGLYQDGYVISKSLFNPISTIASLLTLLILFISAFLVRSKAPIVTLAILFFLAAHLMESTVIGLELYFEHRNYLAALFLFLPIAYYLVMWAKQSNLAIVVAVLILAMISAMTYLRADLWSNSDQLELYWAQTATDSPRALNSLTTYFTNSGRPMQALEFVEAASDRLPDSSFLTMRVLMQKVYLGLATEGDFLDTASKLKKQKFDTQTVMGLRVLTEYLADNKHKTYGPLMIDLIDSVKSDKQYRRSTVFVRVVPYLQARLHLMLGNTEQSFDLYSEAIKRYKKTSSSLQMVTELAMVGELEYALQLLDLAELVFHKETDKSLDRSRLAYEEEFIYLRKTLEKDILEQKQKKLL